MDGCSCDDGNIWLLMKTWGRKRRKVGEMKKVWGEWRSRAELWRALGDNDIARGGWAGSGGGGGRGAAVSTRDVNQLEA